MDLNSIWNNNDNNNEDKTIKKFAIFMNNGQVITIDAFDYEWDDDVVEFYGDKFNYETDNVIATFKLDVLYAVSQCCYKVEEKILALPMYENNSEEEETE